MALHIFSVSVRGCLLKISPDDVIANVIFFLQDVDRLAWVSCPLLRLLGKSIVFISC